MIRRQLPVYSPITFSGIVRAKLAALRLVSDPRPRLVEYLARMFSAQQVLLYGSGSQALRDAIALAMRRLKVDTVALPAFQCYDVAAAAVGAGARIAFYDVDPETLSPDLETFRAILGQGVRLAVVAPLYGYPVDWDLLAAEAARHGAVLIEDAAQGQGATWKGRPLGSLGSLSVLSFGRGKGWTGGSGGALLLRGEWAGAGSSAPAAGVAADLRVIIQLVAQWWLGRPALYGIPSSLPWLALGETVYRDVPPSQGISRAAAAAVLAHAEVSAQASERRREYGAELLGLLSAAQRMTLVRSLPGGGPAYLRLPVRCRDGLKGLGSPGDASGLGVAQSYPSALVRLLQVTSHVTGTVNSWTGAEELARSLVTLPTHQRVSRAEREAIVRLLSH